MIIPARRSRQSGEVRATRPKGWGHYCGIFQANFPGFCTFVLQ